MPKVSICLPNLNNRPFLRERFDTIFNQTLRDWELIVVDNYSEDGAWELIQQVASSDARLRVSQAPREGMYANWNNCVRQVRGDYVYIATSDDTMMPDCLERMVSALESNPDCGICQCQLVIIDESGAPYPPAGQWNHFTLGAYDQNVVLKRNKRMAPHDGLVHPALLTIYTSITQLLIRRKVFDRVGLFDGRWGSVGDFEWEMRAALVENCIYIPDKLATWRKHQLQATQHGDTIEIRLKMIDMARAAFARARTCEGSRLDKIDIDDLIYFLERDILEFGYNATTSRMESLRFLLKQFPQRPQPVIDHVLDHFQRRRWGPGGANRYGRLNRVLERYGVISPVFEGI